MALLGARLPQFFTPGAHLMAVAVAATLIDLVKAAVESWRQGDPRPLAREAVKQATGWAGALALGAEGAGFGLAVGGPVGMVVFGILGGIAGGFIGFLAGSWLSNLF